MAEIRPFRGIIYNKEKVADLDLVLAPPYDIITPELQGKLYELSPYNIVRLDLGKEYSTDTSEDNRYTRASRYLEDWLKEGILKRDESDSIYIYQMNYLSPKGFKKTLRGFVSLVKLEEPDSGAILPHENTYIGPRVDRLNLLRATRTNLSLIFSLYPGEGRISKIIENCRGGVTPLLQARDSESTIHTLSALWVGSSTIKDKSIIEEIVKEMGNRQIFIADGHHRYETALLFRDEMRKKGKEGYDYVMMFLADVEDEGLTILPTHRLIRTLTISNHEEIKRVIEKYFEIKTIQGKEKMLKGLEERNHYSFGMYMDRAYYLLTLKEEGAKGRSSLLADLPYDLRNLDSAILHFLLFEKLLNVKNGDFDYERNVDEAIRKVDSGDFRIAFFMNPPQVSEVRDVALSNERMPPKTTFFYPKLLTGMVMNKF
jgi:uncharacterized protein (DUF1015 family)